ncbi:protein-L-isoaspartate O-methyltransferase [Alkalilimnicola ehrlichii]|uniref:Protein-L-isoaspartate O-methyltransferase n=1 Tax=Alkalilimnicola ehrlichii TaxID=351052 RepID=A0A3E0WWS3_9GAMM|nr:protein-L-isoaspartate O-methyltransferase [Alkalilimnicola ehrlichii]RFA30078.1 protein-L-isoaspartate O-methyltransferase [Alkalilimnicola ehrlichii]RFA37422.1 protein-L-isoaspartate O-methyltransferase [Alkalilimnicola ehrlichii]
MTQLNIEKARFNMVEQQIRTWDVLDQRVLDTVMTVQREEFAPARYRNLAFADLQIPLDNGQVMLEPKLEARILQALNPQTSEQALEIGTGTGYFAACLAALCAHVTSVDIYPEFRDIAARNLEQAKVGNVTLATGDAAQGWVQGRRYDVIAVTGSLPEFHRGFHNSLTVGGRLFMIAGEDPVMEGLLITRVTEDEWSCESLLETSVPPLVNAQKKATFAL